MSNKIEIAFNGAEEISIEPIGHVGADDLLRALFALTDLLSEYSELNSVEIAEQLVKYKKSEMEKK